ncbi:MAG: ATP-binding protein [Gammaproteobacteria bacterium]|nr:ATP-binding protein [Gammaproteobacteria bacterium]
MSNEEILLDTRFTAQPSSLHDIRQQVENVLKPLGLHYEEWHPLVLAVDEACTNVIRHTYHFDSSRQIELKIIWRDNTLVFRLCDDGNSVDPKKMLAKRLNQAKPGGLGLHFIHEIMDKTTLIDTHATGNTLEMVKHLPHIGA